MRDIAHLYLSRMRRPGGGGVRLVVAGMSADVIPAFHVANLALAAAARGIPAHIEDRSGLPVNAGCFLGLDPHCWVAREDGPAVPVAAFARVTFTLSRERGASIGRDPSTESGEWVEVVHVPPFDTGFEHAHALLVAISHAVPTVVLYLAERDAEPRPWREMDERERVVRRVAYVTRAGRAGAEDGGVGAWVRWKRSLTDPLPVAVRDPDSRLARQYADVLAKLFADAAPTATDDARARLVHPHAASALQPR